MKVVFICTNFDPSIKLFNSCKETDENDETDVFLVEDNNLINEQSHSASKIIALTDLDPLIDLNVNKSPCELWNYNDKQNDFSY